MNAWNDSTPRAVGSYTAPDWSRLNPGDHILINACGLRIYRLLQERGTPIPAESVGPLDCMMLIGACHLHRPLDLGALLQSSVFDIMQEYQTMMRFYDPTCARLRDGAILKFAVGSKFTAN